MAAASDGERNVPVLPNQDDFEGAGIEIINHLLEFIPANCAGESFDQYLSELLEKYGGSSAFKKITQEYYSFETDSKSLRINNFPQTYPIHACEISIDGESARVVTLLINFQQSIVYVFDLDGQYYSADCANVHLAIKSSLPTFEVRLIPLKKCYSDNWAPVTEQTNLSRSLVSLVWGLKTFYEDRYLWYKWVQAIITYSHFDRVKWKDMINLCQLYSEMFLHVDVEKEHDLILDIIQNSVKSLTPMNDVINKIEARYEGQLRPTERDFIESRYFKICMVEFIQEAQDYLTENIEAIKTDLIDFLDGFKGESEIPQCFNELKYFALLGTIRSLSIHQRFVVRLRKLCFATLEGQIKTLNTEIDFINETKRSLRNLFISDLSSKTSEQSQRWRELMVSINESNQRDFVQYFVQYLKSSTCPEFQQLKTKAFELDNVDSFILIPGELVKVFAHLELDTKRDNHGTMLIFRGGFIRLKDVQDQLDKSGVYEIQIIATELLCIEVDLTLPGTNLVLISPCVFVSGKRTLNVSGADGEKLTEGKAGDGKDGGDNGDAGNVGNSGKPGGNVFIYAKRFINDNNLTIKSHGGDGQKGQDGGNGVNGVDGKDGYEMSQKEFDMTFPKSTTFFKFLKSQTIDTFLFSIIGIGGVYIIKYIVRDGSYYEMTTSNDCKVVYSAYSGSWYTTSIAWFGYPKLQGYCIHKGGEGTPGGQGGMGGSGGKGGYGGCAGDVICQGFVVNIENKSGRNGKKGEDGRGGKGGYNGRRGLDTGRTEPSQWRGVRSYGPARLKLKYVPGKEATSDTAYCPYQSDLRGSASYAKIKEVDQPKETRVQAYGERTARNEHNSSNPVKHGSVPICMNAILDTYRHIVDTDRRSITIDENRRNSRTHMRVQSSHELSFLSSEQQHDVRIQTENIKKAVEGDQLFTVGVFPYSISEIIDKINDMAQISKEENERNLKRAIEMTKTIELALTKNLVDCSETLAYLLDFFSKMKPDQTYFQRLKRMVTVYADSALRIEFNIKLDKLQIVTLKKYKFARLRFLATEMKRLELIQHNRSDERCREDVVSVIKMRLVHLNCETVATLWSLPEMKQISSFVEKRIKEVESSLSHICNIINSFERRTRNEPREVTDRKRRDVTNKENQAGKTFFKRSSFGKDKQSLQIQQSTQINASHKTPESECVSQTIDKHPSEIYCCQETNNQILEMQCSSRGGENASLESRSADKHTSDRYPEKSDMESSNTLPNAPDGQCTDARSIEVEQLARLDNNRNEKQFRKLKFIEQFRDAIVKTEKYQQYVQVVDSLNMLQYVDVSPIELLLDVLTTKPLVEGFHLSPDLFLWFISQILEQASDSQSIKMFLWIISTNPMEHWLAEYTVLQLIYKGQLSIVNEGTMRDHLNKLDDIQWIPALWTHLFSDDIIFSDDILLSFFSAVSKLEKEPYDDNLMMKLADTNLSQWTELLTNYKSYQCLLELPVVWATGEAIEADAYVDELRKVHGNDMVNYLLETFKNSPKVTPEIIIQFLRNFYYEVWPFSRATCRKIENKPVETWEACLNEVRSFKKQRSLQELIEIMKDDRNNSPGLLNHDQSCSNSNDLDVERVLGQTDPNDSKVAKTFGTEFCNNWAFNFDTKISSLDSFQKDIYKNDLRKWANDFRERVKLLNKSEREEYLWNNITEVFAHVEIGLSLINDFKLRHAQRLAAILLVRSNRRGLLEQVSTGEGKTIIIVAFCIVKNLIGHSVDVITSSPVLAKRDVSQNAEAYELFGISVSHNCSENVERRAEAYKKNIVYGEIGSFQRDVLLQQFYNKSILGKREFDTIVVDEVDSMLLDKAENVLYLSHDIVDLDALEPIFVYIWSFVHGKGLVGTDQDIAIVYAAIMSAIYGTIRKEDLEKQLRYVPVEIRHYSDLIWQELLDMKVIDSKGKLLRLVELKNNQIELGLNEKLKIDTDFDTDGVVLSFLKDTMRQGTQIVVPNYLERFIGLHLTGWIKSAFSARFMQDRRHYVIDIDKSDADSGENANVIIMDVDTGVEQCNMQWSDGLHQFLQLKHGCRISLASLKAVFMSNLTFFNLYEGSVFGLTGTLGFKQEREVLQSLYKIDYINLPTFRPKRFVHHEGCLFDSEDDWIEKSVEVAVSVAKQRPVLVICETIRDLEKFRRKLVKVTKLNGLELHVYKSSYEILDIVHNRKVIEKGCVILATNLAGRGTDIKISNSMDDNGGLHVIFTYMPRNMRVTEQGFGRAARTGQKGSGQLCIMNTHYDSKSYSTVVNIMSITKKRNAEEKERLNLMKEHYDSFIKKEESYLRKFQEMYRNFQKAVDEFADISEKEVVLQACLDRWAFWLDSVGEILGVKSQDTESLWDEFKMGMERDFDPLQISRITEGPSLRVKLGKAYIKSEKYLKAMEIFEKVIVDEPSFSESAHYYKAHCVIKSTRLATDSDNLLLTFHLLKAEECLKKKIEVLSELNNMVTSIKILYSKDTNHFIVNDSYERQKGDYINILDSYCGSVRNILGHEVDIDMLENVAKDIVFAGRIIKNEQLFQVPRFRNFSALTGEVKEEMSNYKQEQMAKLFQRYELYSHELKARISSLQGKKENSQDIKKIIRAEDFQDILPSRSEFWNELKTGDLFCDEKEYIVVNKNKISSALLNRTFFVKILTSLSSDDFKNLFSAKETVMAEDGNSKDGPPEEHQNMILVCMFPEHIKEISKGNYIVIPNEKAGDLGAEFRKILESCDAIYTNKTAYLKVKEAKTSKLAKYDGLSKANLLEIPGVNDTIAKEIFIYLTESGILKDEIPKISEINLPKHKKFETEVKNLLKKYYAYRIFLLETVSDGTLPFEQLHANPHRFIWRDLIELNIVTPLLVRQELEKEKVEAIITDEQNSLKKLAFNFKQLKANVDQREILILQNEIEFYYTELKGAWNSVCYFFGLKDVTSVSLAIEEWRTGLFKYESVDSCLKDIHELLDDRLKRDGSAELILLENKGFGQVLILEEEKWTCKTICKIVAIVILGIAQIALGVIIEVFSLGLGTFVAAGFIEEGVSDIMFAIECAFSGYCTFKDYMKHKIVSVMFTVLTGGVGAFFARGAQFSRFGYKIGAECLMDKAGKELIKEVGMRRLAKECAKVAGKKIAKGVAIGAVTKGIDVAIETLLRDQLKEMCNDILNTLKSTENDLRMYKQIDRFCKTLGREKAKKTIMNIAQEYLKSEKSQLVNGTIKVLDAASSGMQGALKKLGKLQKGNTSTALLTTVASCLSEIAQYTPYLIAVVDMKAICTKFTKNLPERLQVELKKIKVSTNTEEEATSTQEEATSTQEEATSTQKEVTSTQEEATSTKGEATSTHEESTSIKEEANHVLAEIKDQLVKHVEEILTNELLKPFLQHHAKKLVNATGKSVRTNYRKYQSHRQTKEFHNFKKFVTTSVHTDYKSKGHDQPQEIFRENILSDYHRSLVTLQRKVRNPDLYADILREGVPMGIHEAQAISNVIGWPIKIVVCGGDGRKTLPEEFKPTSPGLSDKPPLVVYFQAHVDKSVGHFSASPHFDDNSKTSGKNNCLLDAVSKMVDTEIDREAVAQIVRSDPKIRDRIQRDIHRHFTEIGGIGGAFRGILARTRMMANLENLLERRRRGLDIGSITGLRDTARPAGLGNTGNHELFAIQHVKEWVEKTFDDEKAKKNRNYTWIDLHLFMRVDTRYCVYDYKSLRMNGHPVSVFTNKKERAQSQMTKGSHQYLHTDVKKAIDRCNTPEDAACAALQCHFDTIGSKEQFEKKSDHYFHSTFTATGHDLSKKSQRDEYLTGLERERYKIRCVLAWLQGNILPQPIDDVTYRMQTQADVKKAKSLEAIGDILMNPEEYSL